MNLMTILIVLLCLMALISAVVVLSAIALGGRAHQFEDEELGEPFVAQQDEPDFQ